MIKSVAQAVPSYAMNIFLLPQKMCTEMEGLMSRFFWRSSGDKDRGINWKSRASMCKRKSQGGLGFRRLYDFNVALLGKQAWRLLTNQDALVSKLYQARYYPHCSFLDAKIGNNPSYVWRSILQAQMLIKSGAVRRIGDGSNTDIMSDPWLPTHEDHFVRSAHQALRGNIVSSLMITGQSEWDMEVLGEFLMREKQT